MQKKLRLKFIQSRMAAYVIRMGALILAGALRTVKSSIMIMVNPAKGGRKLESSIITLMQRMGWLKIKLQALRKRDIIM